MMFAALAGTLFTLRFLYVDRLLQSRSPELLTHAATMDSSNAGVYRRLAELDTSNRCEYLLRAIELEPLDAGSMIEVGLIDEAKGLNRSAEQWLLRAASADRTYLPAWTLANYYFRRSDATRFWTWARKAAAVSPGDLQPLFRLCFLEKDDACEVEKRVVSGRPLVERRFLSYLLGQRRIADAAALMKRRASSLLERQPDVGATFVEKALEAGHAQAARDVWDAMSSLGLTPYPPSGTHPTSHITNGSFAHDLTGKGFDWRRYPASGVGVYRVPAATTGDGGVVRMELSAGEPYHKVIEQHLALPPDRRLRLKWRYRASGLGLLAEVVVVFRCDGRGNSTVAERALQNSEAWREESWIIASPADLRAARLAVVYRGRGVRTVTANVELAAFTLSEEPDKGGEQSGQVHLPSR